MIRQRTPAGVHEGSSEQAAVTGSENLGTGQTIIQGAVVPRVTSVTAVRPDGRSVPGVVTSGRGFSVRAWIVGYPPAQGVHLVFRDSSGIEVASLGAAVPSGPPEVPQPSSGGVAVFQYPASTGHGGTVLSYLVRGRVGFWWGSLTRAGDAGVFISPVPAAGAPALGGLYSPFSSADGQSLSGREEAFGYAHADVARVVLRLPDGQRFSTSTFAAGWPGSDLRLWAVSLPPQLAHEGTPSISATGYDAAGHVVGKVNLGLNG